MSRFIDEIQIYVASGKGGPGSVSFRRESMLPRGGPDGGDGGKGGDLIFQVNENLVSLVDYKPLKKYMAENGAAGAGANCSGKDGEDRVLDVPPGTLVKNEEGELIWDSALSRQYTFLKGGRGGKGNHFFRTSVNQAPEHAQPGEEGEGLSVKLILKSIADVGIIGFPNVGKSTLISRISAARPKIADYPFTTLTPNLGVVKLDVDRQFVVADIPGLIKGASTGIGLGIQFLRHIERTKVFVHIIDVSGFTGRDPVQDFVDINDELLNYDKDQNRLSELGLLADRPQIVVLNKIDTIDSEELARVKSLFTKQVSFPIYEISAVTGKNIKELVDAIASILRKDQ